MYLMTAKIIDGKKIAETMKNEIQDQIRVLHSKGIHPRLTAILVGEDPASKVYIRNKEQACLQAGLDHETLRLPTETTENDLLTHIRRLNADPAVSGILVQLPLPKTIQESAIIEAIEPRKDVDCFHPENIGRLMTGEARFLPCTPAGVVELLVREGIPTDGRHVVIVGRSNIVGKPLANMLIQKSPRGNATVTLCHTATLDLGYFTRQADILIVAVGKPERITGEMIKPGAVVIDVGINRINDTSAPSGFRLCGDVHFESAARVASAITPVPGGVGPMTIVMLLHNTLKAAELQRS